MKMPRCSLSSLHAVLHTLEAQLLLAILETV